VSDLLVRASEAVIVLTTLLLRVCHEERDAVLLSVQFPTFRSIELS
jgi:hypothetical protein